MIPRRDFLHSMAGALAASTLPSVLTASTPFAPRIRAVAFDGFAVFDPTPVAKLAESIVPGHGGELMAGWRTRQFEYQWLRTLGGQYADFRRTAEDGLVFSLRSLKMTLTPDDRGKLLDAQLTLQPWPDAVAAIRSLHESGVRLAFLSNMTGEMLTDGARRAGLLDAFEHVLSTDRVRAAKPDPRAYRMAVDAFGLPREEIAFAAFAGWDAAGATWFGYPTVWTNRLGAPSEELGAAPAVVGRDLSDVVRLARAPH
jgi:2-haloacid dehalogenase